MECCSDFVVSSYTPTLGALLQAQREVPSVERETVRSVLVAEPFGADMPPLPGVVAEVEVVMHSMPSGTVTLLGDPYAVSSVASLGATVDSVLEAAPAANILHLACHGQQDHRTPLESGFRLRDGTLTVRKLMQLRLPRAIFAFLCACETAKGAQDQPDQAIHLAGAMLFCGFRSVIGTMW
jgi:CHAT domain-containing protein